MTLFYLVIFAASLILSFVLTKYVRDLANTSEFPGAFFASSLQNSYYPRHDRTFGDTMNRFAGGLSSDAITDLLAEFAPDMKRLFRRHAPKEIRKIEEKLPIPPEDKP